MRTILILAVILSLFKTGASYAIEPMSNPAPHSLYFGIESGYGSTTWTGLVPFADHRGDALKGFTPVNSTEGGAIWGVIAGYKIIPNFAIEGGYARYPNAKVQFDEDSLFAYDHNRTYFTSHTETYFLIGKFLVAIPRTHLRAYSGAGPALLRRWDILRNQQRVTPKFAVGFEYDLTPHVMFSLNGDYTAGYGEAELEPAENYMPFLYSFNLGIAYRV